MLLDPTSSQGTGKVRDAYPLLCLCAYSPVVSTEKKLVLSWLYHMKALDDDGDDESYIKT